ncbi:hypothetical protein MMC28_003982 [Mycoblastus sanguinarius]|nr:hypothetical protein [Mycoblastus sanguinarius]
MSSRTGSADSTTPLSPQGLIRHWWSHNIGLTLQHTTSQERPTGHDPRDYLALERTYLAHLRTSGALVIFGVGTVQLFFLKDVGSTTGVVLGVSVYGGAIMVALVGCSRYFIQQRLLVRGKAMSGGWDVMAVWVGFVVIFAAVFVVVLVEY